VSGPLPGARGNLSFIAEGGGVRGICSPVSGNGDGEVAKDTPFNFPNSVAPSSDTTFPSAPSENPGGDSFFPPATAVAVVPAILFLRRVSACRSPYAFIISAWRALVAELGSSVIRFF